MQLTIPVKYFRIIIIIAILAIVLLFVLNQIFANPRVIKETDAYIVTYQPTNNSYEVSYKKPLNANESAELSNFLLQETNQKSLTGSSNIEFEEIGVMLEESTTDVERNQETVEDLEQAIDDYYQEYVEPQQSSDEAKASENIPLDQTPDVVDEEFTQIPVEY